jgi:hypothetical protein
VNCSKTHGELLITVSKYATNAVKVSDDRKMVNLQSRLINSKEQCYQKKTNCNGSVLYQSSNGSNTKVFFSGNIFSVGKELTLKRAGYIEYDVNDKDDLSIKVTTIKEIDCVNPIQYSVNKLLNKYYFTLCDN